MADDPLQPIWSGLLCLGGGLVFHLLRGCCGREIEALAGARKITKLKDLGKYIEGKGKKEQGLVAVVGRVNSDNPLPCKNSRLKAVILEESVEQFFLKQVTGSNWVKDSTFLLGSKQQAPWYLEDSTGRAYVDGAQSASGFELVMASDVIEEPSPTSAVRTMLDVAQGVRVLCVRRIERILPVGSVMTVVGEVTKGDHDKLVLRRPKGGGPFFVSTKSIDSLVSLLGQSSSWCKWISWGCTLIGVVTLLNAAVEHVKKRQRAGASARWRRSNQPAQSDSDSRTQDGGQPQGQESCSESVCVICMEKEYNIAFFPCGHVCCCKECMEGLTSCPLCRERITQRKVVYLH